MEIEKKFKMIKGAGLVLSLTTVQRRGTPAALYSRLNLTRKLWHLSLQVREVYELTNSNSFLKLNVSQ